jgi:phosphoglycerate-specific signal transduction histidine kinase
MVKAKVDEFKTLLQSYKSDFNLNSETKNIIDAIVAAKAKIHHADYNEKLSSKLNDIKDILYSYNEYTHNQPLLITLNSMEKTLEDIKKNPAYVVDSNGN